MVKKSPDQVVHEEWFRVLDFCRAIAGGPGKNVSFTSQGLFSATSGTKGAPELTAQSASAWLGKFAKWGYVERGASLKTEGRAGRPMSTYTVTEAGWECKEQPGLLSLLAHIKELEEAPDGSEKQAELYGQLFRLADTIIKNRASAAAKITGKK